MTGRTLEKVTWKQWRSTSTSYEAKKKIEKESRTKNETATKKLVKRNIWEKSSESFAKSPGRVIGKLMRNLMYLKVCVTEAF